LSGEKKYLKKRTWGETSYGSKVGGIRVEAVFSGTLKKASRQVRTNGSNKKEKPARETSLGKGDRDSL